jgi:Fe-S-cluster-containing dehydrogenase component
MKLTRKHFLQLTGLSLLAGAAIKTTTITTAAGQSTSTPAEKRRKRYGMVIDLQKCRPGCDECSRACNAAHNIPQLPDPKHEVKWVWKEPFEGVFPSQQNEYTRSNYSAHPVPVMCNHCDNPPCARVCPTGATWKREEDGIVMMDWHRCIGCKYCIVACPYGARSFNFVEPRTHLRHVNEDFPTRSMGVVEKCNFCEERLATGKQALCAEVCPEKAMTFGDLNDPKSDISRLLKERYTTRRKPELGTQPNVFYIL